jgi:DNA-binding NarL/FixJ family response regulator
MLRALTAGAVGYLPKRSSDQELVKNAIRLVADGGYVDPDLGAKLVTDNSAPALEPLSERERERERERTSFIGPNAG